MNAAMAALPESPDSRVVDLRRISAPDLAPVLEEEAAAWRSALDWDLQPSADLVRRFVEIQALNGFALLEGTRTIGYTYYVREETKGLIGDIYVLERECTPARENALIEAALEALWRSPGIHRVEAQLLMLGSPIDRKMPFASWFRSFPRRFMEIPAARAAHLDPREPEGIVLAHWSESLQEETARLVAAAYRDHVDSEINDQYRSPGGARRFLKNIIQYPGCGTFFAPASYAALDPRSGALRGVSLASLVAADSGHITQICVDPSVRGMGLGYAMLRRSLVALAAHGCRTVSLTVTASNTKAIQLYERMGFTQKRDFSAYVWDSW
jgi:ribosomal protein S18 acetylase RimI-like enzyme